MSTTNEPAMAKQEPSSRAVDLPPSQWSRATHDATARGNQLAEGQLVVATQGGHAPGNSLAPGHTSRDVHAGTAGGNILPPTNPEPAPKDYASAAPISDPGQPTADLHRSSAGADLAFACASLSDIESARIAMGNRIGAIQREAEQAEAVEILDSPEYVRAKLIFDALEHVEKLAELEVKRGVRKHPYGAFIKNTVGLGEKQGARMLAAIGDPLWNDAEDRARRGPAELWQYAGHGDPERSRRRRGQKVEFSPEVKMRVHLCAMSCIKQAHSPYRPVYDAARSSWAARDTTDGHKHNHALRLVGKAILLDLWRYAKEQAA